MKHVLFILLALALGWATAQPSSQGSSARERAGYLGPVKHVVIEEEGEDVPRRIRQELLYDEAGQPLEFTGYSYDFMDGSLRSTGVTRFSDEGQVLMQETLDPDGNVLSQVVYRYNETGKVAEQVTYDAAGAIMSRQAYTYDERGNLVREESYRGAELFRYNELTFDSDGNPLTRNRYDGDGVLLESRVYSENGKFFEATDYDEDGAISGRSTARLDERGNFVELIGYNAEGEVENQSIFTYDDQGLLVEEVYSSTIMGMATETVTRYEYSFDEHGNWLQRQQAEDVAFGLFDSSNVLQTLYRTIEYY